MLARELPFARRDLAAAPRAGIASRAEFGRLCSERLKLGDEAATGPSARPLHPIGEQSLGLSLVRRSHAVPFLNYELVHAGPAEPVVAAGVNWNPMAFSGSVG